jgi:FtsZ-binding cell division protein ZapB
MLTKINFYKNYELKINEFESVIKKLNDNNDNLKKELEGWQGKYRQAEGKCRDL